MCGTPRATPSHPHAAPDSPTCLALDVHLLATLPACTTLGFASPDSSACMFCTGWLSLGHPTCMSPSAGISRVLVRAFGCAGVCYVWAWRLPYSRCSKIASPNSARSDSIYCHFSWCVALASTVTSGSSFGFVGEHKCCVFIMYRGLGGVTREHVEGRRPRPPITK